MNQRIRRAMNERDKGFTLIELLVVIIIIGIIAAIAIPVFLNQRKKAVDASMKADLKNAATEVESYMTENPLPESVDLYNNVRLKIKKSKGNNIGLSADGDGTYCISVYNANSSKGDAVSMMYDSNQGGIVPDWGVCDEYL